MVDKICEAGIDREVDEEFWENIYKYCGGSGGDRVNGWITRFFPYVSEERNKFRDEKSAFGGIGTSNIPRQVSEVPFRWIYLGKEIPMKFTAGFLGAEFNKELCQVKPAYFWCVTPDEEKKL